MGIKKQLTYLVLANFLPLIGLSQNLTKGPTYLNNGNFDKNNTIISRGAPNSYSNYLIDQSLDEIILELGQLMELDRPLKSFHIDSLGLSVNIFDFLFKLSKQLELINFDSFKQSEVNDRIPFLTAKKDIEKRKRERILIWVTRDFHTPEILYIFVRLGKYNLIQGSTGRIYNLEKVITNPSPESLVPIIEMINIILKERKR